MIKKADEHGVCRLLSGKYDCYQQSVKRVSFTFAFFWVLLRAHN